MNELYYQFKTNKVVQYTVIGAFLLIAFLVPESSYFTTFMAIVGLILGRVSYNDHVDDSDI